MPTGAILYDQTQSLTEVEKLQARSNIGVLYSFQQAVGSGVTTIEFNSNESSADDVYLINYNGGGGTLKLIVDNETGFTITPISYWAGWNRGVFSIAVISDDNNNPTKAWYGFDKTEFQSSIKIEHTNTYGRLFMFNKGKTIV